MKKLLSIFLHILRPRRGLERYSVDELKRDKIRISQNGAFLASRLRVVDTERDGLLKRGIEATTDRGRKAMAREAITKAAEIRGLENQLSSNDQQARVVDVLISAKTNPTKTLSKTGLDFAELSGEEIAEAIEQKAVELAYETEQLGHLVAMAEGREVATEKFVSAADAEVEQMVQLFRETSEAAAAMTFEDAGDVVEDGLATARRILSDDTPDSLRAAS